MAGAERPRHGNGGRIAHAVGKHWFTDSSRAEGEEADVRLAADRVSAGYRVAALHVENTATLTLRFVFERARQLSDLRLPASLSLVRWTVAAGIQCASLEEEGRRFGLLTRETLRPALADLSQDVVLAAVGQQAIALRTPTAGSLAAFVASAHAPVEPSERVLSALAPVLDGLTGQLVQNLGYDEPQISTILDLALGWFLTHLHRPPQFRQVQPSELKSMNRTKSGGYDSIGNVSATSLRSADEMLPRP